MFNMILHLNGSKYKVAALAEDGSTRAYVLCELVEQVICFKSQDKVREAVQ